MAHSVEYSGLTNYQRHISARAGAIPKIPAIVSGGTLTSDANYYYRTFKANGTLLVSNNSLTADILVISGGGGGGCGGYTGVIGGLSGNGGSGIVIVRYTKSQVE